MVDRDEDGINDGFVDIDISADIRCADLGA